MSSGYTSGASNSNVLREIYNQETSDYRISSFSQSKAKASFQIDSQILSTRSSQISNATKFATQTDTLQNDSKSSKASFFTSVRTLPTSNETVTPLDVQFNCENTSITIIPKFSADSFELVCGTLGPFRAAHHITVPVWVALMLKRQRKCIINKPAWMDVENIEKIKTEELNSPYFQVPPHVHYKELTKLLLNNAADDIENADEIRTAIKDLWDIRTAKLLTTLKIFLNQEEREDVYNNGELISTGAIKENQEMWSDIDNITQLELTTLRDPTIKAMNIKRDLTDKKNEILECT